MRKESMLDGLTAKTIGTLLSVSIETVLLWLGKFVAAFGTVAAFYKLLELCMKALWKAYLSLKAFSELNEKQQEILELVKINAVCHKALVYRIPSAIYYADASGNWTLANPVLCKLFGLSEQEMLGSGWLAAICRTTQERTDVWHQWQTCINDGMPYEASYEIKREGKWIKLRSSAISHRDADGAVVMITGVIEQEE